ncbi:hypothetical protein BJ165DRAFT_1614625 [Panaeolus papilionaceus]|nr:hypothetical protein BJ165DRAFT_1614625 [Panaeolus papilionaceus]
MSGATSPTEVPWVLWGFHAATFSALVLQLLEYLNDLPAEIEFFTNTPKRPATYLYAWSRYFGLVAQVSTLVLNELGNRRASWKLCMATFIAKGVCAQLMISCVEAILMIRVHALYSCNRGVGRILTSIFLVGTLCEIVGSALMIRSTQPLHDLSSLHQLSATGEVCGTTKMRAGPMLVFALGTALVQGTVVISTVRKIFLNRRSRWHRTPLVSLMVRDGIAIFIMLAAMISTVISMEVVKGQGPLWWNVSSAWFIGLLSIGGCRLILNMRKLTITRSSSASESTSLNDDSTTIEFDTIFSDR